jgi:hypothetical protein
VHKGKEEEDEEEKGDDNVRVSKVAWIVLAGVCIFALPGDAVRRLRRHMRFLVQIPKDSAKKYKNKEDEDEDEDLAKINADDVRLKDLERNPRGWSRSLSCRVLPCEPFYLLLILGKGGGHGGRRGRGEEAGS